MLADAAKSSPHEICRIGVDPLDPQISASAEISNIIINNNGTGQVSLSMPPTTGVTLEIVDDENVISVQFSASSTNFAIFSLTISIPDTETLGWKFINPSGVVAQSSAFSVPAGLLLPASQDELTVKFLSETPLSSPIVLPAIFKFSMTFRNLEDPLTIITIDDPTVILKPPTEE